MKHAMLGAVRVVIIAGLGAMLCPAVAGAQMRPMGMPLTTTMVISRPGPEELFGTKQVVTMGIGRQEYKFILDDAYIDDPGGRIQWPDVWQQVRIYRPNFVVQGQNAELLTKLNPGDVVTVKGMYAPLDRTFEVMFVQPGKGAFEERKAY